MRRTNLIDSPGLLEQNHQLFLGLVDAQVHDPRTDRADRGEEHARGRSGAHRATWRRSSPAVKPVYTIVTANGKPAVLLSINRQPDSNTVAVADEVHAEVERIRKSLPPGVELEPFYDQSEIVTESIQSVRDAILIGLILASLIMVLFLRDWGTSLVAGLVIPVTVLVTFIALKVLGPELQPDDAGRAGGGRRTGDRRRHRGGREHRAAPRRRTGTLRGHSQRAAARSRFR